jgi:hypothetical protein
MTGKIRILAGTKTVKIYFEKPGTHHIGDGQCTNKGQAPEQTFFSVIQGHENQDEQVKRGPENRIPEIGQKKIKDRIGPLAVQFNE